MDPIIERMMKKDSPVYGIVAAAACLFIMLLVVVLACYFHRTGSSRRLPKEDPTPNSRSRNPRLISLVDENLDPFHIHDNTYPVDEINVTLHKSDGLENESFSFRFQRFFRQPSKKQSLLIVPDVKSIQLSQSSGFARKQISNLDARSTSQEILDSSTQSPTQSTQTTSDGGASSSPKSNFFYNLLPKSGNFFSRQRENVLFQPNPRVLKRSTNVTATYSRHVNTSNSSSSAISELISRKLNRSRRYLVDADEGNPHVTINDFDSDHNDTFLRSLEADSLCSTNFPLRPLPTDVDLSMRSSLELSPSSHAQESSQLHTSKLLDYSCSEMSSIQAGDLASDSDWQQLSLSSCSHPILPPGSSIVGLALRNQPNKKNSDFHTLPGSSETQPAAIHKDPHEM